MAVKKRKERARKEPEGQLTMLGTKDAIGRTFNKETHKGFGWVRADEPGRLAFIHKDLLSVDDSYQRGLRDLTRLAIARHFSWAAFGVLSVAKRRDGSLYVFDGQHRLAAVKERPSIQSVPCIVFEVADDVAFEAQMFLKANRNRKPVTAFETFKADMIAGDPVVAKVNELLDRHGYTLTNNPGESARSIRCVALLKHFMRTLPEELEEMFPLVVEISGGGFIDQRVLAGVVYCNWKLKKVGLNVDKYRGKLVAAGRDGVMREISRVADFRRSWGYAALAEGVLNIINHRLHNKISFGGGKDDPVEEVSVMEEGQ
jgi:hypothetical protein